MLAEQRDRAVVDHLARAIAPGRVQHLPDLQRADVARHDAIEQPHRVRAADVVLVQRRDVEQRRRAPDRVVLAIVDELVRAGDDVARPAPPRRGSHSAAVRAWKGVVFSIGPAESAQGPIVPDATETLKRQTFMDYANAADSTRSLSRDPRHDTAGAARRHGCPHENVRSGRGTTSRRGEAGGPFELGTRDADDRRAAVRERFHAGLLPRAPDASP